MSETTEREANNRRIFSWLGLDGCWHEAENEEYATVRCRHCGNGYGGGAWSSANPDYYSPTGCLELIEAARAKGHQWFGDNETGQYGADVYHIDGTRYESGRGDDLPTATVNAVLALIDSLEGK